MDNQKQSIFLEAGRLVQDTAKCWAEAATKYELGSVGYHELQEMRQMMLGIYLTKFETEQTGIPTGDAKAFLESEGRSRAHVMRKFGLALDLGLIEYRSTFDPQDKRLRFVGLSERGENLVGDFLEASTKKLESLTTNLKGDVSLDVRTDSNETVS